MSLVAAIPVADRCGQPAPGGRAAGILGLMTANPVVEALVAGRVRFTVEQYERMGEVGILGPDTRTELLDGEIVAMSPIGPKHAGVLERIAERFYARLLGRVSIRTQNPMRLLPRSEPQPDLVVARRRHDFYEGAHPTAEDTLLAIEVADTSLRIDRLVKLPIYARHGVPEVWIVDIAAKAVHVHTDPVDGAYRSVHTARGDDALVPTAFPDVQFTASEMLGA